MTWDEFKDLLVEMSDETRVVNTAGFEAVALNLVPAAWFISLKFTNALSMGVYQGEDHRLVGSGQIPLVELTAEFVCQHVALAIADQVRAALDPEIVDQFLRQIQRLNNSNIDSKLGYTIF